MQGEELDRAHHASDHRFHFAAGNQIGGRGHLGLAGVARPENGGLTEDKIPVVDWNETIDKSGEDHEPAPWSEVVQRPGPGRCRSNEVDDDGRRPIGEGLGKRWEVRRVDGSYSKTFHRVEFLPGHVKPDHVSGFEAR